MLGVECRSIWTTDMRKREEDYAWCIGNVTMEENVKDHVGDEQKMNVYDKKSKLKDNYRKHWT